MKNKNQFTTIRNYFFFGLDYFLPRKIAKLPYLFAFYVLDKKITRIKDAKVWYRNSIKRGNFVFGVSDLDTTILISREFSVFNLKELLTILTNHKRQFPFLGETNFYFLNLLEPMEPALNYYERKRDPELMKRLPETNVQNLEVEKAVFILRMIYADREKLKSSSFLRQKKWRDHFFNMGFILPSQITLSYIVECLKECMKLEDSLWKEVHIVINFLFTQEFDEQNIYNIPLPKLWRFLYPNKHIWFGNNEVENLDLIRGTFLEKVFNRQLDWESWGLMSQLPILIDMGESLMAHLDRQKKVAIELAFEKEIGSRFDRIIEIINKA